MGTKYLDIYTLVDDVARYEKMLVEQAEKKPLKGTYPIGCSNNIMSAHSLTNSDNKEFEEVQQQLISIIKIKDRRCLRSWY